MCLWATARYRGLSYRLAGKHMARVSERFFSLISKRRERIEQILGIRDASCEACETWGGSGHDAAHS